MASLLRLAAAVAVSAVIGVGLAGCAPDGRGFELAPSGTPQITGEGTPGPDFDPVNETVGVNCQELISDQVVYEWGSGNFGLVSGFVPEAGSSAALIAEAGGLACRWINLTSSETVDVAVSIPAADALAAAEADAAASGEAAPEFGTAYFRSANGSGHLDVFTGGYWMTLDSTWFYETGDAAPLVTAATAALPPLG